MLTDAFPGRGRGDGFPGVTPLSFKTMSMNLWKAGLIRASEGSRKNIAIFA